MKDYRNLERETVKALNWGAPLLVLAITLIAMKILGVL